MKKIFKSSILLLLFCTNLAFACINDYDTRFFESQMMPNNLELVMGNFMRHSKEFYQWRAQDRLAKLKNNPDNLSYYDDLAVSYEKMGQTDKAIETLEKVLANNPNRYETLANLGTFYIHNKQFEKGLPLLKKAVQINPDAHFGREIYQIKVVEYVLVQSGGKIIFPLQQGKENFADFILKDLSTASEEKQLEEVLKALVGIKGMLKFGNSDSPILMEVMGDLYMWLHQKNKEYAVHGVTEFLRSAASFYAAGIIHSRNNDQAIKEVATLKHMAGLENFFSTLHGNLEEVITESKEKQIEVLQKQRDIIAQGGDVEAVIYKLFFPPAKLQEPLLDAERKTYELMHEKARQHHEQSFIDNMQHAREGVVQIGGAFVFAYIFVLLGAQIPKKLCSPVIEDEQGNGEESKAQQFKERCLMGTVLATVYVVACSVAFDPPIEAYLILFFLTMGTVTLANHTIDKCPLVNAKLFLVICIVISLMLLWSAYSTYFNAFGMKKFLALFGN